MAKFGQRQNPCRAPRFISPSNPMKSLCLERIKKDDILLKQKRLCLETVGPGLFCSLDVFDILGASENNHDRERFKFLLGTDAREKLKACHAWHVDIDKH